MDMCNQLSTRFARRVSHQEPYTCGWQPPRQCTIASSAAFAWILICCPVLRNTLACFRLGQHWLQLRHGRFGPNIVPCHMTGVSASTALVFQVLSLLHHMLFACPLYQPVRIQPEFCSQGLENVRNLRCLFAAAAPARGQVCACMLALSGQCSEPVKMALSLMFSWRVSPQTHYKDRTHVAGPGVPAWCSSAPCA